MDDWQARQMATARQSFIAQHQHAAQSQHHQAQQAQQVALQQAAQQQAAQQQAAQQQQIAAAIAQRRNSSFFMPPFNQTGHQMAMVTTAKLALPKKNKSSLSNLAVRSTVPRQNVAGGIYSVAQWARKCVEDNIEFLVKLTRRNNPKEQVAMLAYGDGCQTLILLDEAVNKIPGDISKVKKISIGVSAAPIDDKSDEIKMASTFGVLTPTDCLWDHLRYEQSNISKDNPEHIMFLHTTMKVYGEGIDGRRRVLQVKTEASKSPYEATEYISNPEFEQAVLARWTGHLVPQAVLYKPPAIAMNAAAAAAYVAATTPDDDDKEEKDDQDEFVITFNPKEILLLEKAFDENLTSRDLKSKAYKWEEKDTLKCQETIKRLQNEFTLVDPQKKKNTAKKATTTAKKAKKSVKCSPKKLPMKKDNPTESKKSTPKKQDLHDKKDGKVETSKTKLKSLKKQGDKKKIETGKTELKSSKKQGDKKKIEISKTELKSSKKQGEKKKEEKVKKAKRPSISKGKAIPEPLKKKVKSPSASTSKVKKETPKKTKKEPEKSSSPENSDDELVTSLKKPENGKPKVGREEVNTSSKSKSTPTKKSSTDKKRKSITKKQSTSEKKTDSAGKKRGREKSHDAPKKNSKKARSKSKSSDSK